MKNIGFIKLYNSVNTQDRFKGTQEMLMEVEALVNKKIDLNVDELLQEFSKAKSNVEFFKLVYGKVRSLI